MGNCLGLRIPKYELAHFLQLAVVADIAGAALVAAREQGTMQCRIQAEITKGTD